MDERDSSVGLRLIAALSLSFVLALSLRADEDQSITTRIGRISTRAFAVRSTRTIAELRRSPAWITICRTETDQVLLNWAFVDTDSNETAKWALSVSDKADSEVFTNWCVSLRGAKQPSRLRLEQVAPGGQPSLMWEAWQSGTWSVVKSLGSPPDPVISLMRMKTPDGRVGSLQASVLDEHGTPIIYCPGYASEKGNDYLCTFSDAGWRIRDLDVEIRSLETLGIVRESHGIRLLVAFPVNTHNWDLASYVLSDGKLKSCGKQHAATIASGVIGSGLDWTHSVVAFEKDDFKSPATIYVPVFRGERMESQSRLLVDLDDKDEPHDVLEALSGITAAPIGAPNGNGAIVFWGFCEYAQRTWGHSPIEGAMLSDNGWQKIGVSTPSETGWTYMGPLVCATSPSGTIDLVWVERVQKAPGMTVGRRSRIRYARLEPEAK